MSQLDIIAYTTFMKKDGIICLPYCYNLLIFIFLF